ncbi:MAG TPA: hypothetical protein VGO52_01330 [Hyphomonadaceae bacterium]|nr:hypothetical protein [Hyphomonadaceae bacterium]
MSAFSWDEWDRLLARSVFGTDDDDAVEEMVLRWVREAAGPVDGGAAARIVSWEVSVGAVIGLEFGDARKAALKVWPGDGGQGLYGSTGKQRAAQVHIQSALAEAGYPAPKVLAGLSALGAGMAMLMAFDRSGEASDVRKPGVRDAMARGLAEFIGAAAGYHSEDLPDWRVRPDEPLWPKPHNVLFDFEKTTAGAEWIDAIAAPARERMKSAASPLVVGHGDWSAKNMRMEMTRTGETKIAVVYDWDSVMLAPETFVVGSAAAHFPVTWELPVPETPEPGEMAAFVSVYEDARGRKFSQSDLEEIAAYATFSRAYKARCEHCGDGPWGGSRVALKALEGSGGYTAKMLCVR